MAHMRRGVTVVAAAILAAVAGGCGDSEPGAPSPSPAPAPAPTPAPAPAPAGAMFLELVWEVDRDPLEPRGLPEPRPGLLEGYVLLPEPPRPRPRLYPALDDPRGEGGGPPGAADAGLWIGVRRHDRHAHGEPERRLLAPPGRPLPAELRVSVALDGDAAVVRSGDSSVRVRPGGTARVLATSETVERAELADRLLKAYGDPRATREEAMRVISELFPGDRPIVVHSRVTAIHHGQVEVAGVDLLHEWREAARAEADGSYLRAEEALEDVLAAVPEHDGARAARARIASLLERRARGSRVTGTLVFPPGTPTAEQRALWERFHAGLARLVPADDAAAPGGPDGRAPVDVPPAPVRDGAFTFAVPDGKYRLTVAVPGFKPSEQTVEVKGESHVRVELRP